MRIRQSLLGSFDICGRRFQYDLEAPRDVYHSGSVRAVGTAYHGGEEFHYLKRMEGYQLFLHYPLSDIHDMAISTLNDEIEKAGDAFKWDEKFPDYDSAAKAIEFMLTRYFEDGHAWPEDWTVLGVEHKFELTTREEREVEGIKMYRDGHTRTGTIDLVLEDPNGWIYGVDHKTAGRMWDQNKHKPRKNNQSGFYVAALRELYPKAPGHRFVFDIMTYKGVFERRVSDPTEAHCQAILDKALQVAALYEGMRSAGLDLPTNPNSTLCSSNYCDYFDICPSGAVLDT